MPLIYFILVIISAELINRGIGGYARRKHGNTYSSLNRKRKRK